jgi:membrane associated rhomboid family serine protease
MYFFYFYPLGLDVERRRQPVLTIFLLLCMTGLFIWARFFPTRFTLSPADLVFFPGNQAPWTVVTAVFLHVGWLHFLSNAVYLWVFAPTLEDRLGRLRLLYYFLMLGAAGNLLHGYVAKQGWLGSSGMGVIGASGAIAGLLAFCLVRFAYARLALAYWVFAPINGINRAGRAYLPVPIAVILWMLLQIIYSVVARETGSSVSYGAHFGGFALGLFLAYGLGYHRQARTESHLNAGQSYLAKGQAYAAEGAFMEYLAEVPDDLEARLQLARARRLSGRLGAASGDYRDAFQLALSREGIDSALSVYEEARRCNACLGIPATDLATVAFYLEKKLDFRGAVEAYLTLFRLYPTHRKANLAVVRAIMLTRSRLGSEVEAQRLVKEAWRHLKPSVWRDLLEREFDLRKDDRAEPRPDYPGCWPEPII